MSDQESNAIWGYALFLGSCALCSCCFVKVNHNSVYSVLEMLDLPVVDSF